MSQDIQDFFLQQGYPDVFFIFDPAVAQACQNLVYDLLLDKKPKSKAKNTHTLLLQAVEKHLDMLLPVQEAVKNWLACYDLQKSEYLLSRELSDYGGSPRLMSKWLDSFDSLLLYNLVDFLVYIEDDLAAALNKKKTNQVKEKSSSSISCFFCWRGVDPPQQYCSHHSPFEHPTVYARFQAHLKRLGLWLKKSERKIPDYAVPYYCRSGPRLPGDRIKIHRPIEFRWTALEAPSVIQRLMPLAAIRMEETKCWEALKEGWPKFVEKVLAAFESESREEQDLLLNHPKLLTGALWVILERYELWSRWWREHPFPGRGKERSRHAKAREHQVQKYLDEGLSKIEIAKRTGLSRQAIYKIIGRIGSKKKD
uniref:Resolvase HTH domain-containing protein n=1 Tax=Leptospirillum sp. Group II '5-way CG' TaxID=419541 RepID=B6ASI1_9BACT|nr:MAG: Protein of unknown function [Leptospirillum sp. Group II '5-way CG']